MSFFVVACFVKVPIFFHKRVSFGLFGNFRHFFNFCPSFGPLSSITKSANFSPVRLMVSWFFLGCRFIFWIVLRFVIRILWKLNQISRSELRLWVRPRIEKKTIFTWVPSSCFIWACFSQKAFNSSPLASSRLMYVRYMKFMRHKLSDLNSLLKYHVIELRALSWGSIDS